MLTTFGRWLRRQVVRRELPAAEFRADRMDAAWRPEYRELGGQERPLYIRAPRPFYQ